MKEFWNDFKRIAGNILFGLLFIAIVLVTLFKDCFISKKSEDKKDELKDDIKNLEEKKNNIEIKDQTDEDIKKYWEKNL